MEWFQCPRIMNRKRCFVYFGNSSARRGLVGLTVAVAFVLYFLNRSSTTSNDEINKKKIKEISQVDIGGMHRKAFSFFENPKKFECDNILRNMTAGRWKQRVYEGVKHDVKQLDEVHRSFRVYHEGFSEFPYRTDRKCGFRVNYCNYLCYALVDSSAWCDHNSERPCCTHRESGKCVTEGECRDQPNSLNLASYTHAEISDWVTDDARCNIINHDQATACDLLRDKNVKSIGFVGNSLIRNIYAAMLQMLTNNYYNGTVVESIEPSLKEKCVNQLQNLDKYCLAAMASRSDQLPKPGICEGKLETLLYISQWHSALFGDEFKKDVEKVLDQEGAYLLVGIGLHDASNGKLVIEKYLKPTFDMCRGHKWPKIIWIHTTATGIFKPRFYISMHGNDVKIKQFNREVEEFCDSYGIPSLNFVPLTTGVWSQDGQHFGTGVNLMKVNFLLNILASGQVFNN